MGFATSSDLTPASLAILGQSAVAGARVAAANPHNDLVPLPPGRIDADAEMRLSDPAILALSPEEKLGWAHAIEAAARGADPRVRRFRNSGVSTTAHAEVLVTSDGASRTLHRTGISAWSTPVAEANGSLQTESWYDSQSQLAALASPASIGQMAGERAARMLGARPVATQRVPVIFEPGMAAGFMRSLLAALGGDAVFKGASFLGTRCGEAIAASGLNLVDDPHLPGGMGSAPFDGEGLPSRRRALIEAGVLRGFLYDGYTARKAGVAPTACAQRSSGGLPQAGVFNLQVLPGTQTPAELVRGLPRALLLTRGLGHGLNAVSGEYSRGANGLWLEHGEVVHPVQEITIAGDALQMLQSIDGIGIGSDLQLRGGSGAPSLRFAELTVSGR